MYDFTRGANGEDIQLQFVDDHGAHVMQHPINLEALLQMDGQRMPLDHGISLTAEEYRSDDDDDYDDAEEMEENSGITGRQYPDTLKDDAAFIQAPPGTQATGWHDVLNALQHEAAAARTGGGEAAPRRGGGGGGGAQSTQLTLLHYPNERPPKSLPAHNIQNNANSLSSLSRQELWASFAPPAVAEVDYGRMHYRTILDEHNPRLFRPCALSFHATTSYTSAVDKSQRVVMYGGLTRGSFETIHPEMYEFTLLNGSWRRVEGRRCSPAGHYAHTLTAVSAMDRLVVVGGIGPGGMLPDGWQRAMQDDHLCEARVALLMPFINTRQEVKPARLHGIGQTLAPSSANVGFVPFAFDMSLADQTWRAITTSTPITCCFHSAVAYGKEVLLFGGVNEYLQPTDELRVLDVESYNLRTLCFNAVTSSNARPCARYLHSAVRFGQYMIIYGGFDAQNEPLEDCWAFDIINERWEKLTCSGSAGPRAGHSACVVGARMMIVGGVASTLRHDAIKEDGFLSTIAQLNLVPTAGGEYVWRHAKLKHPLPPMAFGGAAPCGDDLSILMCGGLTTAKLRGGRGARAAHPARARSRSTGPHSHSRSTSPATQPPPPHHDADDVVHPLANTYHTIDDSLLVTYAAAKRTAASTTTAGASDEDDEHRDPNALPPTFSAFLRRQEDFLKKKNAAVDIIMTKATLAEREGMEPALYLKEDEIERLIQMSERCCTTFSEAYKVENLPSHVPDRDARVHILENCISLTRQARDILKSMKASVVGLSAVKSKTHRAGTKFEDYAAAKPFRRIAVAHLLSGVATELEAMHELNKSLKNSLWEEKQLFMDAIATMGKGLHQLNSSIAHVMAKYIGNRVTSLMKGVEKHKEVMQRLTEVVERNRHDKIFASNAGPDKQRERVKKEWAKGDAGGAAAAPLRRATSKHAASSSRQHQSMGAGYFRDEADARIIITDAWVKDTRASADRIDALAETLLQHLEAGKGALLPTTPGVAPLSTASNATTTATSIFAAPPSLQPLPLPLPLGMPTQDAHALAPPPTAAANNTTAPAPRDAVIQRSNDLRDKTASVVADVRQAVRQFVQEVVEPPPPPPPQPTVSVAELIAPPVADASALPAPPSALLPPPNLLAAANIIAAAAAPPPPAPTVAAPPTHDATPTPRHLALASLRPLLAQKDRLHKAATKTPLIRLNQWDGNDLAGAPQDERAELLTRKLYSRLAGLVQLLSASFLSKAGAKAPRAKPTSQSIQAPPPAKTRVRGASAKVRHASSSSSSPSPPRRHTTTVEPNYSDSSFESAEEEEVGTSSGALTAISPELRRYAAPFTLAAPTTTTDVPASTSSAAAAPATVAVLSDAQKALMALSDGVVPSSITSVVVLPNNTSATSLSISAPAAAGACIYSFGHQPAATAASSSSCTAATAGGALHASAADIAVSTGVVVHREPTPPPAVVAPPPTTAAAAVAATTALPQDPATSISPGPFVVNSEYFAQAFPTRTSVAHVVGAAADEPSPHRWAEAEEDYFYFGRLPRNTDGQPSTALAYPSCVVAPARSVRVLPRTAPPVGSEVGSLHVNAHLVSASNRSGVRGARYATSARPSASTTTAAAMLASGTRGRMTLGEQRIAEARKRHETR